MFDRLKKKEEVKTFRKDSYMRKNIENEKFEKTTKDPEEDIKKNKKRTIKALILWIVVILLGLVNYNIEKKSKTVETVFVRTDEAPKEILDKIYIYYPEGKILKDAEILVPKIKSKDDLLKGTINETVKKLKEKEIIPNIETKDINYYVLDKKIYLDLPEKIFTNVKDAESELLLIYSFVNSLTNINGIESVRILINTADLEKVKYANLLKDYTYKKDIE